MIGVRFVHTAHNIQNKIAAILFKLVTARRTPLGLVIMMLSFTRICVCVPVSVL